MTVDPAIFREPAYVRRFNKTNTGGVVDVTPEIVATIWVQWTPLQGRLLERAKSFGTTINTTLKTLYRPDIAAIKAETHDIYLPNRGVTLTGVIPVNDNGLDQTLTIYCSQAG